MKKSIRFFVLLGIIFTLGITQLYTNAEAKVEKTEKRVNEAAVTKSSKSKNKETIKAKSGFVYTEGTKLMLAGEEYIIKGICASNAVAANLSVYNKNMMMESDYKEIAAMGFNTVRFLFNYRLLEDDDNPYTYKESGWEWIDKNIKWASQYGIKIVLDCHISQGGIPSTGGNTNMWNKGDEKQERFVAMWSAIASRYKDSETVLGYGILNEPTISYDQKDKWTELAQRVQRAIRDVDNNHILIFQRVQIEGTNEYIVPNIANESKWMLEVHKYPLIGMKLVNNYLSIPDYYYYYGNDYIIVKTNNNTEVAIDSYAITNNQENVKFGEEWKNYAYITQPVEGSNNAYIRMNVSNLNEGQKIEFADIIVYEYENGKIGREVYNSKYNLYNAYNKYLPDSTTKLFYDAFQNSIIISGKTGSMAFSDNSNLRFFKVDSNKQYLMSYKVRMSGNISDNTAIKMDIKYYHADKIYTMDKEYVYGQLNTDILRETYNVPVFYGEVGVPRLAYDCGKSIDLFVDDMMEWLIDTKSNFAWFTWHEPNFGLYTCSGLEKKTNPNTKLIKRLKNYLNE